MINTDVGIEQALGYHEIPRTYYGRTKFTFGKQHKRLLPKRANLLEIGCSQGYTTVEIASDFPEGSVLGIDLNADVIQENRAALEKSKEEYLETRILSYREVSFFPRGCPEEFISKRKKDILYHNDIEQQGRKGRLILPNYLLVKEMGLPLFSEEFYQRATFCTADGYAPQNNPLIQRIAPYDGIFFMNNIAHVLSYIYKPNNNEVVHKSLGKILSNISGVLKDRGYLFISGGGDSKPYYIILRKEKDRMKVHKKSKSTKKKYLNQQAAIIHALDFV